MEFGLKGVITTIVGNNSKQNIRLSFIIVNMSKCLRRDDVYMMFTDY